MTDAAAPLAAPPAPRSARAAERALPNRWVVLGAVLLGTFTYGTINTILSAALKTVATDLGARDSTLAWAITAPFLAIGIGNPIFGRVGDVRGRRMLYLVGLGIFVVATFGCAVAPNAGILIAGRALAGCGSSIAMPNGMALVLDRFAPDERARALGWFNLVGISAPAIGLALGGPLIDALGWRSVFLLYGAIAAAGVVAAAVLVREQPRGDRRPVAIDLGGAASLAVAMLGLMLGITFLAKRGVGDPITVSLLVGGGALALAFIHIERRVTHPIMALHYFGNRAFTLPIVAYFTGHIAYMGGFVVTPILFNDVLDIALGHATFFLILRPLSFGLASPVGASLADHIGTRATAVLGSVSMVASMVLFCLVTSTDSLAITIVALIGSGLAFGLVTSPFAASVSNAVANDDLGAAQGMFNTSANLGTVVAIQLALIALGDADPHTGRDFLAPFAIGIVGALAMLAASAAISRDRRP